MTERNPARTYAALVERLIDAAGGDARIKALWLEGKEPRELRRPYGRVEVHLAADEPDFDAVLAGLEKLLAGPAKLTEPRWSEVQRFARQIDCKIDGEPVTAILEKTSLLAKRKRLAVAALADKTGHLYHVLDFVVPPPGGS